MWKTTSLGRVVAPTLEAFQLTLPPSAHALGRVRADIRSRVFRQGYGIIALCQNIRPEQPHATPLGWAICALNCSE